MHESWGHRALRGLYSLVIRLALPLSLYYLIWRGLRQREYLDRWSERFALYRGPGLQRCLWVHAVSVGEVNVAAPLVAADRGSNVALTVYDDDELPIAWAGRPAESRPDFVRGDEAETNAAA